MKIGFYTPNYPGISREGGIGSYTRTLGKAIAQAGHEVHVLTPGCESEVRDGTLMVHGIPSKRLPLVDRLFPGANGCWHVGRAMRNLVKKHGLDIVEFPNWEGFGLWFQVRSSVPTVVRLHTSSHETQVIDQLPATRALRWDVKRERWQAKRASALVTHSQAHRNLMSQELGCEPETIELIPHGVPVFPNFIRTSQRPAAPKIVYLGRLEKRKGTIDLLHAIPGVLASFPEAQFMLIGQDRAHCPGGRTHAQFVQDEFPAGVRKQIQLAGRLPDDEVTQALQSADLFVAPSHYESFGLIFPEAMRWGTPVIGTWAGGIPEIIQHEKTGLLVEPQKPEQLSAAIQRLLGNETLRRTIGEAGRRSVEEEFSVERAAGRAVELFARVLGTRAKTAGRERCLIPS